jgi:hypothetical protein
MNNEWWCSRGTNLLLHFGLYHDHRLATQHPNHLHLCIEFTFSPSDLLPSLC